LVLAVFIRDFGKKYVKKRLKIPWSGEKNIAGCLEVLSPGEKIFSVRYIGDSFR
jgi:hypothetical protein